MALTTRARRAAGAFAIAVASGSLAFALFLVAYGRAARAARADVIVVLGARAYADGRPSGALRDRVETAAALYARGFGGRVMVSGGVDPSGVSEPEVVAAVALAAGASRAALVLDKTGANTAATVAAAAAEARRRGWRSALFASHDYHLARVARLAARAGLAASTATAVEARGPLRAKPLFVARELAARVARAVTRPGGARRPRARRAAKRRTARRGSRSPRRWRTRARRSSGAWPRAPAASRRPARRRAPGRGAAVRRRRRAPSPSRQARSVVRRTAARGS
jgi:uncharacterized SAM-binding protein YcdF (DUF218 family)